MKDVMDYKICQLSFKLFVRPKQRANALLPFGSICAAGAKRKAVADVSFIINLKSKLSKVTAQAT